MERKLKKSEARLSTILGSIANGVIATKSDGTIQYFNDTAEFISGILADTAKEKEPNLLDLRRPSDGSQLTGPVSDLGDAHKRAPHDPPRLPNASQARHATCRSTFAHSIRADAINGQVCVIVDITDQVEADNQLSTLGHALESITDGVIILEASDEARSLADDHLRKRRFPKQLPL